MAKKKKRAVSKKQSNYIVFYKVSIFTALVIIIGAFLIALFSPLVSNMASVLGVFTSR